VSTPAVTRIWREIPGAGSAQSDSNSALPVRDAYAPVGTCQRSWFEFLFQIQGERPASGRVTFRPVTFSAWTRSAFYPRSTALP